MARRSRPEADLEAAQSIGPDTDQDTPNCSPTPASPADGVATTKRPQLRPQNGLMFAARWDRLDGYGCRQRFFRRAHAAERFAGLLEARGFRVAVYSSPVQWTEHML